MALNRAPSLSILCVSKGERYAPLFLHSMEVLAEGLGAEFVVAADGDGAEQQALAFCAKLVRVASTGCVESVLDAAVEACGGEYILRLDTDELASIEMEKWLALEEWKTADHWCFPRAYLWGDTRHYLTAGHFWPDFQTRLSIKAKAGGRGGHVHALSPFGMGTAAPCAIEHHKFLVTSREEREDLVRHYDRVQAGAGSGFRVFYLPEDTVQAVAKWPAMEQERDPVQDAWMEAQAFAPAQIEGEFLPCVRWLLNRGTLTRVLEIGTHHGGTAAFWCALGASTLSIDLPGGQFGGLSEEDSLRRNMHLAEKYLDLFHGVLGDSHSAEMEAEVLDFIRDEKADLLFIDADHTYEGVKQDYEMYHRFVRPGGVILFHDIGDTPFMRERGLGVYRLWAELKKGFKKGKWEYKEFNVNAEWGGLGAVVVE